MEASTLLRVVVAGSRLRPRDFKLRRNEQGLSLFAEVENVNAEMIIAALRSFGKQGDLAVAELRAGDIRRLGLVLVHTPIETGDPRVDACHFEARLSDEQRNSLGKLALDMVKYFNDELAPRLCELAKLVQ